jgi:hypothetical protein
LHCQSRSLDLAHAIGRLQLARLPGQATLDTCKLIEEARPDRWPLIPTQPLEKFGLGLLCGGLVLARTFDGCRVDATHGHVYDFSADY